MIEAFVYPAEAEVMEINSGIFRGGGDPHGV